MRLDKSQRLTLQILTGIRNTPLVRSFALMKARLRIASRIFIFCCFLLPVLSPAQTHIIDSLKNILREPAEDSNRVKTLNSLSWALRSSDPSSATKYAEQARDMAERVHFDRGRGDAFSHLGVIYYRKGEYVDAIKAHLQALSIRERIGDQQGMVISYINLGNVYSDQNNNALALDYYKNAATLISTLEDQSRLSTVYLNISAIYLSQKKYQDAFEYCQKAKDAAVRDGDKSIEALALNNMGVVYENQEMYEQAMNAYQQAYTIQESLGDKTSMVDAAINVGSIYRVRKQFDHALEWHFRAEKMAREIDYPEGIRVLYEGLSKDYEAMGKFEEALHYHIRFKEVSDSLFNDENSTRINELTDRWKNERRERELMAKEQELAKRIEGERLAKQRLLLIGIGAFFVLIFAGYVFYAWQQNKRANVLLAAQKQVIERKNEELGIKNKDITDSIIYSRRIQRAMLPSLSKAAQHLPNSFILYRPRDIVSGDFFWIEAWGNDVLVAAGDCTGHGVPGALLSVVGINMLNQALQIHGIGKPAPILNALNKTMTQALNQNEGGNPDPFFEMNDGMDIALVSINRKTMKAEFAGANNPLWLLRNNELIETGGNRLSIGQYNAEQPAPFTSHEIDLQPGDLLYLFTDGYADQFGGEAGKKYKSAQMKKFLLSISQLPVEEQKARLEKELDAWKGTHAQVDDILVIGIKI